MAYTRLRIEQKIVYYLDIVRPDDVTREDQERALYTVAADDGPLFLYDSNTLGRMVWQEEEYAVSSENIPLQMYRKTNQHGSYASFETRCPHCLFDNQLAVVKVTLEEDGKVYDVEAELVSDGFDIYDQVPPYKNLSTDDELVHCAHCNRTFSLSDVCIE